MAEKKYKYFNKKLQKEELIYLCHEDLTRQLRRYKSLLYSYKKFITESQKKISASALEESNMSYPTLVHVKHLRKLQEKFNSAYSIDEAKLRRAIEEDDLQRIAKYTEIATKKGIKLYNSISETLLLGIRDKEDVETLKTFEFESNVLNKAISSLKQIDVYMCDKIEKYENDQIERE